ncbi:MAG: exosortase/archaeosortase family protein [Cyanobacteriota bacterium]|nr:exosortase/archaeosortase family protein [Cyanobacteriota bacterium]
MIIASMVILGSITRAWQTHSLEFAVMVALVWSGAVCAIEDQLARLCPRPRWRPFVMAAVLLIALQWRQERVIQPQGIMLVLPMLQGIGLLLLVGSPRRWHLWRDSLLILALLPVWSLLRASIPEAVLSRLTTWLCQILFLSFGADVVVDGPRLALPGGGVVVTGPCSGSGMVAQLVVVGAIFALLFPTGAGVVRWLFTGLVMAVAPIFAVLANTLRIALLAVLNASDWPQKQWWFDYFHSGDGGLVFSLLAVMAFAPTFFYLQDHLLLDQQR